MNREVHVRFWERAEVQFLRATRQRVAHNGSVARAVIRSTVRRAQAKADLMV